MKTIPFLQRHRRARLAVALACAALVLAGCAGQHLHREGLALLEQGRYEEALAKLEQASRAAPDEMGYRSDLLRSREQVANRLLAAARAERAAERFDAATQLFGRVLELDPGNGGARQGLDTVAMDRRHAAAVTEAQTLFRQNDPEGAQTLLKTVLLENPSHGKALLLRRQINEQQAKELAAGPTLQSRFRKPVTLQFREANLKMVFESLSRTSGINILLDKDVKGDLKTSISVRDASVEETIDLILLQNQLEKRVLSDNTIFIYPNTPAKLKEHQELKIRSFHLVHADAKQIQTMIKTLLKTKDLFIHEKTNSLIMRDTPEAIRLAERMVADQDVADPEVMLEVEVLEVTRSRLSAIGIAYPDSLTLSTPGGASNPLTFGQLRELTSNNLIASPLSATLNLKLQDSDVNLLASPRIRARNREKAKILIGDRVPVINNSITPLTSGGQVVTGRIEYLDVGLKLDVEPDIHLDGDIGIKVSLEVSNVVKEIIDEKSGSRAYQIGTRTASTVLRLKDGETQVLAGLINDEDRKTASKVPGLGQLPVLGRLFSSHNDDGRKSEILLSITPRLVGAPSLPDAQTIEFWTGTEATLRSAPLTVGQGGSVALATGAGVAQPAATPKGAAPPSSQPPLLSWQGPAQARVGDRFNLMLNTQLVQGVANLALLVGFDPAALRAVEVVEGGLLKQNGASLSHDINPSDGQISVELTQGGKEGVSGAGGVATITFEVIAAQPQSQITATLIAASGASGEPLPLTPPGAHIMVLKP